MWNHSDTKMYEIIHSCTANTKFPQVCPVCTKATAHLYIHRHDSTHGGLWIWCSTCHTYEHASYTAPPWWKNPSFVSIYHLTLSPDFLDTVHEEIDKNLAVIVIVSYCVGISCYAFFGIF